MDESQIFAILHKLCGLGGTAPMREVLPKELQPRPSNPVVGGNITVNQLLGYAATLEQLGLINPFAPCANPLITLSKKGEEFLEEKNF